MTSPIGTILSNFILKCQEALEQQEHLTWLQPLSQSETAPLLPQMTYHNAATVRARSQTPLPNMRLLPDTKENLRLNWINVVLEGWRRKKDIAQPRIPICEALHRTTFINPTQNNNTLNNNTIHTVLDISAQPRGPEHYLLDLSPRTQVTENPTTLAFANTIDPTTPRLVSYRKGNTDHNFSVQHIEYQTGSNSLRPKNKDHVECPDIQHLEVLRYHQVKEQGLLLTAALAKDFEILSNAINTLKNQRKTVNIHHNVDPVLGQLLVFYHKLREQLIAPGSHYDKDSFIETFDAAFTDLRLSLDHSVNHMKFYLFLLAKLYNELIEHELLVPPAR